jgi:transposase
MNQLFSAQEMARRNNENGAVYAAYQRRCRRRKLAGKKTKCTAKELDDLDWQAAEREARPVRAVGFFLART